MVPDKPNRFLRVLHISHENPTEVDKAVRDRGSLSGIHATCSEVCSGLSKTPQALPKPKGAILIGCLAVALATVVRLLVDPLVHDHGVFLFFAVAVALAAIYGGHCAGIAATLLSVPVCDYFFVAPRHTLFIYDARGDSIMIALFAIQGLLTTGVIHCFHRIRIRLRQSLID